MMYLDRENVAENHWHCGRTFRSMEINTSLSEFELVGSIAGAKLYLEKTVELGLLS